jgi:hypothetical protein
MRHDADATFREQHGTTIFVVLLVLLFAVLAYRGLQPMHEAFQASISQF